MKRGKKRLKNIENKIYMYRVMKASVSAERIQICIIHREMTNQ